MSRLFNLIKANLGITPGPETTVAVVDGHKVTVDRVDAALPAGLRIGAYYELPKTLFLGAEAFGSVLPNAEDWTGTIKAISVITLADGWKLYRAYLDEIPENWDNIETRFIQILVNEQDGKHTIEEAWYFATVYTEKPVTAEQWDPWIGPEGIGGLWFTDNNGNSYTRATGQAGAEFSPRIEAEEHAYRSADGLHYWMANLEYHLYERPLGENAAGGTEGLLIESVMVTTIDKHPSDATGVRILAGLKLPTDTNFVPQK